MNDITVKDLDFQIYEIKLKVITLVNADTGTVFMVNAQRLAAKVDVQRLIRELRAMTIQVLPSDNPEEAKTEIQELNMSVDTDQITELLKQMKKLQEQKAELTKTYLIQA